jgi:hypothetical protein
MMYCLVLADERRARPAWPQDMPAEMRYHVPADMLCPKCRTLMRLVAIEPSPLVTGADEIKNYCGACKHEEKYIRKTDKP